MEQQGLSNDLSISWGNFTGKQLGITYSDRCTPYDPAIPFLDVYPITLPHQSQYTRIFKGRLFMHVKTDPQPNIYQE